ncbi:endonuclease VII domain-containing protein [Mycobacteroides abscessus]|uniref:endonuclease VII domain-containing protein n=1 Tax=Mycobacteroides abscessus TaxID=36809 RepID=UPI00092AB798|nr:endonuclease VII domain-containing protein [Mycobacteroides abscessus]QSN49012.1 endonuclease VII domain-containing protein [Mycobacteroides abscessus subsp. abscessus]SIC89881.1 Recombination endonuclease VII [Mycobacteroides abscessus subsp. abscessus]SID80554.1 Recombination endonuclease VII [Mycobacteroides abscessus subsp. abscessus]SIE28503.1 Recombination endonuclease VII [Mycobacteroides abscessus subsp. abscessus]SIJ64564.1 Recombination endonuclease VII [Mycobacteroides abscessus 
MGSGNPRRPRSTSFCKFPGCGRPHDAKGYCAGHYRQWVDGKTLRPIKTRLKPENKVICDRCKHEFYPRIENHHNRCARCRGRFKTDLANLREKSRTAPAGKRWCQDCEKYRATRFFPTTSARCKPCHKSHTEDQRAQRVYSLAPGAYLKLYNHQGGKCAICQRATGATRSLSVDHDHSCCPGKESCGECVRGLLCGGCNYKILGHLRDDVEALERAIEYLRNPPALAALSGRALDIRPKEGT